MGRLAFVSSLHANESNILSHISRLRVAHKPVLQPYITKLLSYISQHPRCKPNQPIVLPNFAFVLSHEPELLSFFPTILWRNLKDFPWVWLVTNFTGVLAFVAELESY